MSATTRLDLDLDVVRLDREELDARYFEYTSAADPVGLGIIPRVAFHTFPASLYAEGPTRLVPLDLKKELGTAYPATGPSLLAHFGRVIAGEALALDATVTSRVLYVVSGRGEARHGSRRIPFGRGDFLALPGDEVTTLAAEHETTTFYYVDDSPLLAYLGVAPTRAAFVPTRYPAARAQAELRKVAADPLAHKRNRVSVLLGNERFMQTRTVTHVLWAMFGLLPAHTEQRPHRHQSIALDLIVDCAPGAYTLVGREVDAAGDIARPTRIDWSPGMAFVTPPGYWHAHYNESETPAHLIPIQDAGLHTYLRSLDIRFAR